MLENHRKKDLLSNGIDGVKFFEIGKKFGAGKLHIATLQSNNTWLQWNVLILYSYIITGEGKKMFQMKGSRNAVVTES